MDRGDHCALTTTVHLKAGPTACDIRPDIGAAIVLLRHGGVPVLREPGDGPLTSPRQAGSFALVPFSNRVAHAVLQWNGTGHPLVRTEADEPHAIHGVGWQRPWEVLDASDNYVLLSHEHRPDAAWPFAYDASQSLRISPGALELTLSVTNQSPLPAPMGLGWHPYFVKRPGAHLSFEAAGRWEMGGDKLPTTRMPSRGIDADCAQLAVDHCFDGWNGVATLHDDRLRVRIVSGLSRLVVFTNGTRPFVAIEPVSHVNNALGRADPGQSAELGLRVLAPGESMSIQMTLEMETAT